MQQDAAHAHTILQIGAVQVNFYVSEPSPDQWNAIGVVSFGDDVLSSPDQSTCRMIVGSGASRDEAIGDLITRVLTGQHPALQATRLNPSTTADPQVHAVNH